MFIYHASLEDQYEVWYNSEKLKEADILTVKKQSDIFDPRWKGKTQGQGMGDPSGIKQMIDSYFEPDRGPDWVRSYLTSGAVTFSDDRRILETWLIGGRFAVQFVASAEESLRALAKKGLPIKQVFLPKQVGMLRASSSGCCISAFANAPHANAAKLFINWFLSKEGQTLTHTMIPNIDRSSLAPTFLSAKSSPISNARRANSTLSPTPNPAWAQNRKKPEVDSQTLGIATEIKKFQFLATGYRSKPLERLEPLEPLELLIAREPIPRHRHNRCASPSRPALFTRPRDHGRRARIIGLFSYLARDLAVDQQLQRSQ